MADIQTTPQDKHQKVGVARSKKLSTRVDLTPMVDLGFLLITFFIFTTSMSEPKGLALVLPKDSNDSTKAPAGKTLNLVLGAEDKVYYYHGDKIGEVSCTNFSAKGLRSVIERKKQQVKADYANADETIILIRPTSASTYKNVVDVLDEILITDVKKYVLMDDSQAEDALLVASYSPHK